MKTTTEASIYIVEDDAHFRETFIDVMALRGVEVHGAGTGTEALHALRDRQPSVIIIDVKLPDIHGLDLCRRIKRMEPFKRTPVILISASSQYNDRRDHAEGLLAGAAMFLTKPITMDKLWAEIETLLESR